MPVVATTAAALFLGEAFLPIQGVGMAIVLVSLTIVGLRSPKILGIEPAGATID